MKFFSIIIIFIMMTSNLLAQNPTQDTLATEGIQLQDIVVTAQFAPQSKHQAVYKVKVINNDVIRHKGAANLSDLLQDEMNIDLAQNSVFGSNIEMQGVSKENIKILIDGVPLIGRLNGIIDLSQINLANIDRVEIIEGPVSVFYGTDAMGGILNLVTKKNQKSTIEGSASIFYESINAKQIMEDIGFRFGKSTIRVSGGSYQFKGLSTLDSVRSENWPKRNDYFGDLMYGLNLGTLKLRYNGHLAKNALFTLGDPNRFGKIKDIDYFTRRIDNSINLNGLVWGNNYINVTTSFLDYQRYHDTYNVDPISFDTELSDKDARAENIVKYQYGGVKAHLGKSQLADKFNYLMGADVNVEKSTGSRILDKEQSINTAAFFSSVNYKLLEVIELQPGLRYTWNSAYGSLLSPAFNAKWAIGHQQKLRFSYARGFRAPTIKELFLDFHISAGPNTFVISGNEELEVEKSHSFNLQYSVSTKLSNHASLLVEPSLFYNTISGLIDLSVLKDSKRHYINIDKYRSVGGRINCTYSPTPSLLIKLGYGHTGRYNQFSEDNDSRPMLFTPEFSSSIRYELRSIGLHLNAFYKYSGKRTGFYFDKQDQAIKETIKDDFHNLSLTISKDFFQELLSIQLGGKNLFDVKDVEVTNAEGGTHSRNLQLWGRTYFAKATINF